MIKGTFYNHVEKNEKNQKIIEQLEDFVNNNPNEQIYLITAPLGGKYKYSYEKNALVILSPKHKIIFIDLANNKDEFNEYYEDFIEDLNAISDKYDYKNYIGRPRQWKKELTYKIAISDVDDIKNILTKHKLAGIQRRKSELLISLLIGSINDIKRVGVEVPDTILEKVKKNIILFDGDQTRFIYKDFPKKIISIQGLSGTGKTELLLHKLKELYISDDNSKIFFTCHNIALANTLKERIPQFFDFMKVEKQIEWNKRLWVDRAWGSQSNPNSGLYSYICYFYNIPFQRYSCLTNYKKIFSDAISYLNEIDDDDFKYAFDYILVDERQDFPKEFFELCKKVARKKVYIAGDIFQNIFTNLEEEFEVEVDVILNRCYRTDPRTLMFAHAVSMGLFEEKKYNWLSDKHWSVIGYKIEREENTLKLYRQPIRRFEELEIENIRSVFLEKYEGEDYVLNILKKIKEENPTVTPEDVAIIFLDDTKEIYNIIDSLEYKILEEFDWNINRAYETKKRIPDALFISNRNNAKGLEFPFVICVTERVQDTHLYRNILYTMLTRSFIQSYLLVKDDYKLEILKQGLNIINKEKCIITREPTDAEKEEIRKTIIKLKEEFNISYNEFLDRIFNELRIEPKHKARLKKMLLTSGIPRFDKDLTVEFIKANKRFLPK